jgi:hypothetical protein
MKETVYGYTRTAGRTGTGRPCRGWPSATRCSMPPPPVVGGPAGRWGRPESAAGTVRLTKDASRAA